MTFVWLSHNTTTHIIHSHFQIVTSIHARLCLRAAALHNIILLLIQDVVATTWNFFFYPHFWDVRSHWLQPPVRLKPQRPECNRQTTLQLNPDCDFHGNCKLTHIQLFLQAWLWAFRGDKKGENEWLYHDYLSGKKKNFSRICAVTEEASSS